MWITHLCFVQSLPMLAVMFSKVTEGDHAVDSSSLVTWKSSIVSWVFVFSGRDLWIYLHRITTQVDDSIKRKFNLSKTRNKIQLKRHYQKQENSENRTNAAQTNRESGGKERRCLHQFIIKWLCRPSERQLTYRAALEPWAVGVAQRPRRRWSVPPW